MTSAIESAIGPARTNSVGTRLAFLMNRTRSVVVGCDSYSIEEFHQTFYDDMRILRSPHTFCEWLFPTDVPCPMTADHDCDKLTASDARTIAKDVRVSLRIIYSAAITMRCYGYTFDPVRQDFSLDPLHNTEGTAALKDFGHARIRIWRVVRCLSLCGFDRIATALLRVLQRDSMRTKHLFSTADLVEAHREQAVRSRQGWPVENCGSLLLKNASVTPRRTCRLLCEVVLTSKPIVAALYVLRRLLRAEFACDMEADETGALPWIVVSAASHKRLFCALPEKSSVVVLNPRTMKIKMARLSAIYKARTHPLNRSFPSQGWLKGTLCTKDGRSLYRALQDSCAERCVTGLLAVWLRASSTNMK